jgi:hypothetical protein
MPVEEVRTLDLSPEERYLLANLCSTRWWALDRNRQREGISEAEKKEIDRQQQRLASLEGKLR